MKYLGSKNKLSKELLPIILKDSNKFENYVEPFCGGCNMIDKVSGFKRRIANDYNQQLICLLKELQNCWIPPDTISEEEYNDLKNKKNEINPLIAFAGFGCSFGGKWFAGYARGKDSKGNWRNYCSETKRNLLQQAPNLSGIEFKSGSYLELDVPDNSIIYCDPPYRDTTKYKDSIDYEEFYEWCRNQSRNGNQIFVSEYWMPDDFKEIWNKEQKVNFDCSRKSGNIKTNIERLYVL